MSLVTQGWGVGAIVTAGFGAFPAGGAIVDLGLLVAQGDSSTSLTLDVLPWLAPRPTFSGGGGGGGVSWCRDRPYCLPESMFTTPLESLPELHLPGVESPPVARPQATPLDAIDAISRQAMKHARRAIQGTVSGVVLVRGLAGLVSAVAGGEGGVGAAIGSTLAGALGVYRAVKGRPGEGEGEK